MTIIPFQGYPKTDSLGGFNSSFLGFGRQSINKELLTDVQRFGLFTIPQSLEAASLSFHIASFGRSAINLGFDLQAASEKNKEFQSSYNSFSIYLSGSYRLINYRFLSIYANMGAGYGSKSYSFANTLYPANINITDSIFNFAASGQGRIPEVVLKQHYPEIHTGVLLNIATSDDMGLSWQITWSSALFKPSYRYSGNRVQNLAGYNPQVLVYQMGLYLKI